MLLSLISHILATHREKKNPKSKYLFRNTLRNSCNTGCCEKGLCTAQELPRHQLVTQTLDDEAEEEAEQSLQEERIQLSFSIFIDAERSSAIQTNCARLCHSAFGGFGGCGSFLHFYARGKTPKEECQHYPAVPQMVLPQTISLLHRRLAGN